MLVGQGFFELGPVVAAAVAGSLTGVSVSYHIARKIGKPALDKYGKRLHITPERLELAEKWFASYGAGFIVIAYFIPGLRHVTPYLAGIARLSFWKTISFSFVGAALWVFAFIYLGHFLAANWSTIVRFIDPYTLAGLVFIALGIYFIRFKITRQRRKKLR